jgi:hypothetical protein
LPLIVALSVAVALPARSLCRCLFHRIAPAVCLSAVLSVGCC